MGVGGQRRVPAVLSQGKKSCTHFQEAGLAPGPGLDATEKLDPSGIRSPDRPAVAIVSTNFPVPGRQ